MNIKFLFNDELTWAKFDGQRMAACALLREIGFARTTCNRRSVVAFYNTQQLADNETVVGKIEAYQLRLRTFFRAWNSLHD